VCVALVVVHAPLYATHVKPVETASQSPGVLCCTTTTALRPPGGKPVWVYSVHDAVLDHGNQWICCTVPDHTSIPGTPPRAATNFATSKGNSPETAYRRLVPASVQPNTRASGLPIRTCWSTTRYFRSPSSLVSFRGIIILTHSHSFSFCGEQGAWLFCSTSVSLLCTRSRVGQLQKGFPTQTTLHQIKAKSLCNGRSAKPFVTAKMAVTLGGHKHQKYRWSGLEPWFRRHPAPVAGGNRHKVGHV